MKNLKSSDLKKALNLSFNLGNFCGIIEKLLEDDRLIIKPNPNHERPANVRSYEEIIKDASKKAIELSEELYKLRAEFTTHNQEVREALEKTFGKLN